MTDIDSLAAALFGSKRAESQEVLTDATTRTYVGTALTDSKDGTVMVDLGGDVTLPDDVEGIPEHSAEGIEVSTGPSVRAGDEVVVTLVGGTPLKTPMVTGVAGEGDGQNERIHAIEADYVKATTLEADVADIGFLKADSATIKSLQADTAKVHDLTADQLAAATGYVGELQAGSVSAQDIVAGKATVGELAADHVSVSDFQAEQASIDSLQAATADIDTIRANSAKVQNLTASELEADHATVGSLSTTYATIANLNAANGRIANLESTKANISDLEADYITADEIEATYMHANMSNSDVAWIENGTIKNGAIVSAMINDVSANKLTAGTINGSVINVTNLNADNITTGTINGQRIGEGSLSLDKLSEDVYTEAEVDTIVDGLNDRIDGAIETHTGTAVPTLNNQPASSWNTTKLRDEHVGDVYYVVNSQSQQNGYCYRFTKSGSTYSWQLIKDSDVTAALSRLTTAEGKITTFDSDISKLKTDTGTLTTKTESLETRMSDAESDILDKVDTTTFNEVSDTVDQHSQTISQHTTAISNKADSSTVTAVTNRVSKNEQDISGINTTIGELQDTVETKADGSTVSTISNKLNTVSDTVDGHTQTLTSVQNTLSTKADSSTVTTLSNTVNTVKQTADTNTSNISSLQTTVSGHTTTIQQHTTSIGQNTDAIALRATKTEVQQVRPAYASSSTAAGTAAKVATIDPAVTGYALYKGASVAVTFSTANTAATPTLNLNSTGAKQIRSYTGATLSEAEYKWAAGATIDLVYDGTYWRMQDGGAVKRVTAAEASISVNAENIESKVSKDGVISSINQSAETVKIQASKVEIDGTAIFTAISSDVDDAITDKGYQTSSQVESAITSKGYATTTQAQGYATTTKSEAISAAATDATTKANAAEANAKAYTDALEIGGRNLLPKTGSADGYYANTVPSGNHLTTVNDDGECYEWSVTSTSANITMSSNVAIVGLESGSEYTLSMMVKSTVARTFGLQLRKNNNGADGGGYVYQPGVNVAANTWTRLTYSFTGASDAAVYARLYCAAGTACTVRMRELQLERGNKVTDWSPAPEDVAADIAAAQATANAAAPKANAVKRTQRIWYRKSTSGAPSTPGTASSNWVTKADDGNDAWTKMHIAINSTHKHIYTCEQYEMADGTVGYTSVLLDNTITVIDGGNIITGSVTANKLNAANINASKTLTVGAMTDAAAATILNSNVQIGGRNLLLATGTPQSKTMPAVAAGSFTTWDPYKLVGAYNTLGLSAGDNITISFDWSVTGAAANSTIEMGTNADPWEYFGVLVTFAAGASSGHVTKTYTVSSKLASCAGTMLRARIDAVGTAITTSMVLTLSNVKLEKGNKATDWTQAPEDMATAESLAGTNESLEGAITDIGELSDQLVGTVTEQNKTITTIQTYLNSLRKDLDAEIQSRQQWLNFDAAEGLVIGAKNSAFKTVTTNTSQQFKNGGTVLAETSGMEFVAPVMRSDQILIGNWMWTRRDNGNLSLKWIG